jgi:hypothetical protein
MKAIRPEKKERVIEFVGKESLRAGGAEAAGEFDGAGLEFVDVSGRRALTPALSPGERGNWSAAVEEGERGGLKNGSGFDAARAERVALPMRIANAAMRRLPAMQRRRVL